jgi:guanine nucleotide-binding protein alpha-1 subunit
MSYFVALINLAWLVRYSAALLLLIMVAHYNPKDPLSILLAPPLDETPEQRKAREAEEANARKVSLRIDEELQADKAAMKKKNNVKVLVLGQSESGMCSFVKFRSSTPS